MAKPRSFERQPRFHVVIVNFNSVDFVADAIRSLRDEPVSGIHILDNGSTEKQEPAFEALKDLDPRVVLQRNEENLGFAGAVNQLAASLEWGEQDAMWVLNPDTRVVPGCVQKLIDCLAQTPEAIVSPMLIRPDGAVWYAGGSLDASRGYSAHDHYGEPSDIVGKEPFLTQFITGAALTLTRSTWETIGPLRDDLFLYWEDTDLSLRATMKGRPLIVVPRAVVEHHEGGSSSGGDGRSAVYFFYYSRNRILVCAPYAGLLGLLFGRGLIETLRALAKPLFRERQDRWKKTAASFRGLWAGIRQYRSSRLPRR